MNVTLQITGKMSLSLSFYISVSLSVSLGLSLSLSLSLSVSLRISMSFSLWISMSFSVSFCLPQSPSVSLCLYVFKWFMQLLNFSQTCVQQPPLGPEKSGRLTEVYDKPRFRLAVYGSNWPLLTGGRCSQVVVKSGLTVYLNLLINFRIIF
jgi:hypothetical protein